MRLRERRKRVWRLADGVRERGRMDPLFRVHTYDSSKYVLGCLTKRWGGKKEKSVWKGRGKSHCGEKWVAG